MVRRVRKTESEDAKDAADAGTPRADSTAMDRFKSLARRLLNVPYNDLKAEQRRYREGRERGGTIPPDHRAEPKNRKRNPRCPE